MTQDRSTEDAQSAHTPRAEDYCPTGPGTPAGRYLRRFWQPVYHSVDLAPGRAQRVRIMSQDYTLYRGDGGDAFLVDSRCPHRGALLSLGWVEGDCIRCMYHGWRFDGAGQCVEQPTEDSEFAHKVRIGGYPVREYLGLVFAYLGDGDAPEFPRYPEFESFEGLIEIDSYSRDCNYFQNVENALDMSHVGFVHGDNRVAFSGIGFGRALQADESDWGVTYVFTRSDGKKRVQQFGMPNIFYMMALPNDDDIGWQESLFWWVPVDDLHHMQFSIHRIPVTGGAAERIRDRRQARRAEIDLPHQEVCLDIIAGRLRMSDVDGGRVDMVRLQDDVAQLGQGLVADRSRERLGRSDVGLIEIRKLWRRELAGLLEDRPLKHWKRSAGLCPQAWGLGGAPPVTGGGQTGPAAVDLVDVRPYVEMAQQLRLLSGVEAEA